MIDNPYLPTRFGSKYNALVRPQEKDSFDYPPVAHKKWVEGGRGRAQREVVTEPQKFKKPGSAKEKR